MYFWKSIDHLLVATHKILILCELFKDLLPTEMETRLSSISSRSKSSSSSCRDSPTSRLSTRTVLEAHSLRGPRTQCTARTPSGTASTAIGTVDPTTAGELLTSGSVLCYSRVVTVNKNSSVKLTAIWKQPRLLYYLSGVLWFLRISSRPLTVPPLLFFFFFFPNELQLNCFIFTPGDSHCINDKLWFLPRRQSTSLKLKWVMPS